MNPEPSERRMQITESQGCLVISGRRARVQLPASDYRDRSCASHFNIKLYLIV